MSRQPTPGDDIIDSRDIIAYIEEVESEVESLNDEIESLQDDINTHEAQIEKMEAKIEELGDGEETEDERDELEDEINSLREEIEDAESEMSDKRDEIADIEDELKPYKDVQETCDGYGDWSYGEALIEDDYFVEYAQQLAYDIGAVNEDASWPNDHIDWEAAADALKIDYMSVDFGGYEYWMRA